jgi:hypothetical protein
MKPFTNGYWYTSRKSGIHKELFINKNRMLVYLKKQLTTEMLQFVKTEMFFIRNQLKGINSRVSNWSKALIILTIEKACFYYA